MILLDQPYVSEFLLETIRRHELPVVQTAAAEAFGVIELPSAITEQEAVDRALASEDPLVLAPSESAIGWITEHLAPTKLPEQIDRFKDKARFRRDTAALFPGFVHREIRLAELDDFDPQSFARPFVIKPSVGFFSLGVHRVESAARWPAVRASLRTDLERVRGMFPPEVLNGSRLLLEPCIEGAEFAIDAYYDQRGDPVVLSIFEHLFASADDTSDRVYVTSAEIVRDNLERFTSLLADLGKVFGVRNFPVHVELRVDADGVIWPIEVNPLRFGGWCTTADLAAKAYGINPYQHLFAQLKPDWARVFRHMGDDTFGLIALGNSTGTPGDEIPSFDYEGLLARFEQPLELRRTDYRRYPTFGFLFTRTRAANRAELDWALRSDLREFVRNEAAI